MTTDWLADWFCLAARRSSKWPANSFALADTKISLSSRSRLTKKSFLSLSFSHLDERSESSARRADQNDDDDDEPSFRSRARTSLANRLDRFGSVRFGSARTTRSPARLGQRHTMASRHWSVWPTEQRAAS